MAYRILYWWVFLFIRLYFRQMIVYGRDNIPKKEPLIVASNHPSAFMEAAVVGSFIIRDLHYLVRGDMFHPRFKWLFDWTHQIPIFRKKDGITNLRKNASSFEHTYKVLGRGEAVLIFPEAKTTLEKRMRPIQRGTAHLAFGALPYLKEGQSLFILPVGVNFTEPRLPGTDVVVRFGKPFITGQATREDRDAIDDFTDVLSSSMSPLIIQVKDEGYDKHYDVLASIYLRLMYSKDSSINAHEGLAKIANAVNHHEDNKAWLTDVHDYIHALKGRRIMDAIYYPELLVRNKLVLAIQLVLKIVWLVAGGWIWRLARHLVFSKIRTITFQGPTSVGAGMVLYPLVALLFLGVCFIIGWPVWYVLVWVMMMLLGIFFRPPLRVVWKILTLPGGVKSKLHFEIKRFLSELKTGDY